MCMCPNKTAKATEQGACGSTTYTKNYSQMQWWIFDTNKNTAGIKNVWKLVQLFIGEQLVCLAESEQWVSVNKERKQMMTSSQQSRR